MTTMTMSAYPECRTFDFSPSARKVLEERFLRRKKGGAFESAESLFSRISGRVARVELRGEHDHWRKKFMLARLTPVSEFHPR
jgi:ribonucleotide reductase alpha subunit